VTLHSIEAEAGVHYLTMELVSGQTLSKLIPPNGVPLKAKYLFWRAKTTRPSTSARGRV
jgi:hypothetical protein